MVEKKRNYRKEYDSYQGTPAQREKNNARHRDRYQYEKEHGPLPKGVDLDHKKGLSSGGTSAKSNLRPLPASDNRSFNRTGPGGKQIGSATANKRKKS